MQAKLKLSVILLQDQIQEIHPILDYQKSNILLAEFNYEKSTLL